MENADNFDIPDSPLMYEPEKTTKGGDANYKSIQGKYLILIILLVIIIYLIVRLFKNTKINGEDYNQRQTHLHFNNLHGDAFDEEAKQTIKYGEAIQEPTAMDHYRLGTTYLIAAHNPRQAHRHFVQALDQIIHGQVEMKEIPFILDRIDDFKDHFVNFPDIEDLPIQRAIMAQYEIKNNLARKLKENPVDPNDPEFKQKVLLSQQNWESDSQNVHDSAIYEELRRQYAQVCMENSNIPNLQTKTYRDAINWLHTYYQDEPNKLNKIQKVEQFLDGNYQLNHIPAKEQEVLQAVWRRAYDPRNKEKFNEIREAIGDAVLDCVEGNMVVCTDGRSEKIWQALAHLDHDPQIGIFKSKQMLRNEILEKSAKIIDNYIGENGSVSSDLKQSFNANSDTEQVRELKECMARDIDNMGNEYRGLLDRGQLDSLLTECKSVIN